METSFSYDSTGSISEGFEALVVSSSGSGSTPRLPLGLCPMCAGGMNDERPLPCSHTICGTCVSAHLWAPLLVCPICRSEHPLDRILGGLYSSAHSPMEKILLDLIQTSNGDLEANNLDGRRNYSGDSNSTSSSNSTPPTLSHSPLLPPNGTVPLKFSDAPSGIPISRFRSPSAQPFVSTFSGGRAKERGQVFGSLSVLNDLFGRKDGLSSVQTTESMGKMLPLSPIVGGETRHLRMSHPFAPHLNAISPLVSLEDMKEVPRCMHGVAEYYCTACRVAFCGDCLTDHKNHRFTPLREAENMIRGLLRELLSEVQAREKDVEESFVRLKALLENLEVNAMIVEEEISAAFRRVVESAEDRKVHLLENLQRARGLKIDVLLKQANALKGAMGHLHATQRGILTKIGSRDTKELIGAHVAASEGLRLTERVPQDLVPHEDATLAFQADANEVLDSIARFGHVHSMGHATSTLLTGVGGEVALLNTPSQFTVRCFDHCGRRRTTGGDDIQASLAYPSGRRVALPISDYGDGDYMGVLISHERGDHSLFVTLRGLPIFNSGQRLRVKYRRPYREMQFPPIETFGKNPGDQATLSRGWGVHCDKDGTVFVTERDIHCVLVFEPDLRLRRKFGRYGDRDGELNRPAGITVDISRRVIVVDKDNHRIQIFTLEGKFLTRFGRRGTGNGEFQYPWDVDTNSKGHIIVSDSRNHRVQLFDKDGTLLRSTDETLGKCNFQILEIPRGVCFDQHGNILIADFNNHHVLVVSPQLQLLTSIGRYGDSDGHFFRPQGVFVDSKGYIFVAESKTNRVQIFSPSKKFYSRIVNCNKDQKPFSPCDISMSPEGFLYVVDIDLGCVYKF